MELPKTVDTDEGPSVEGASAALLTELLPEFEAELARAGVPVEECLAPGLTRDQIVRVFDRLKLPTPDEVAVWFGWHNGTTNLRLWANVFPHFQSYSLDHVESRYVNDDWPHGRERNQWNPNWIQLLGDNNGMAVECVQPANAAPHVRPLTHDGGWGTQPDNAHSQVVSLCAPVTWWIESLRKGEYTWHPEARAWDWDFAKPYDRVEKRVPLRAIEPRF